jgi:hypothetical protein
MKSLPALLLCITLFCVGTVMAQPRLKAGVKVGGMLADIRGKWNEDAPQKFKTGLMAGGSVEYITDSAPLWPHVGLRLEALYVQKGFKDQVQQTDEWGHGLGWKTAGTVYVDEIVLAAFYVARFPLRGITPFTEIGPEIGFPLYAKEIIEFGEWADHAYYPSYWSKKPNVGLNFGVGMTVPAGHGELTIDARYNLGLTNMFRYKNTILWNNMTVYTTGIQLLVGYNFSLKNL